MVSFSSSVRRHIALAFLLFGVAGTAHADAAGPKIGRLDGFWATWDGFDPEAYVMMKRMGERFEKMQQAASIARKSGDDSALESAVRDKLTDEVVDWAASLNPAVAPIKAMGDMAIDGTQRWLDWSFRSQVNQMYLKYKSAFEETGDIKQAADTVSRWLDDAHEVASLAMTEKELAVLRANRALMIASIIDTHRTYQPAKYEGKDIASALRGGKPAAKTPYGTSAAKNPSTESAAKPKDAAAKPKDAAAKPKDAAAKPADTATKPADTATKTPTAATRQAVLNCMCSCNTTATSSVSVSYNPSPVNASPSCNNPSNGACVNQGFGCWRHAPPTGGDCVNRCHSRHSVAPGVVKP